MGGLRRRRRPSTASTSAALDRARTIPLGVKATAIAAGAGRAVGGERGGRHRHPRSTRARARGRLDHRRQRAERAGGRRRRGLGRQPHRRDAVARRPRHERGRRGSVARRPRPDRGRGRRGRGVGGGRRGRHRGPRRPGRPARGRAASRPAAARRRSRSPTARCGPRRSRPRRRTGAGRCGWTCRSTGSVPANWLHEQRLLHGHVDAGGARATTGSSPTAASPAPPARRSSARWPRGRRAPSPDGRTYVFTLRRGIRYSDGTPVRPGDFRASMERYLGAPQLATRSRPSSTGSSAHGAASARRGALRPLARHRVGCARADDHRPPDRARPGVPAQADDAVRVRRAPRHAGAHADDRGFTPPGTGPYRIAGWDARRGGVLVRNPHFRPTAARPAGFADRIEVEVTRLGRVETHTAAVERGSADLTWLVGLPPARQPPGPRRARARPAAQQPACPGPRGCS